MRQFYLHFISVTILFCELLESSPVVGVSAFQTLNQVGGTTTLIRSKRSIFDPQHGHIISRRSSKANAATSSKWHRPRETAAVKGTSFLLASRDDDAVSSLLSGDDRPETFWEQLAGTVIDYKADPSKIPDYVQLVTIVRVGFPSLLAAILAKLVYPTLSMIVAGWIVSGDNGETAGSGVFAVVAQDASQYIQNILTTSGLVFSLLVGQTYYFMYQQQERIYLALFEEVTMAKSLLEQVALVCQGRESLYERILLSIDQYVKQDLMRFNDMDPAEMIAKRPDEDPLETVLYLTSVGEPSVVYQTVKSLRSARAQRLGALQRKLPDIHMTLLWALAGIVLFTFPLLGAGSQTIGGPGILVVQSWYLSFIVFAIMIVMGVIYELQRPNQIGAYNAQRVLMIMVGGLEEELKQRLDGDMNQIPMMAGPSVDSFARLYDDE